MSTRDDIAKALMAQQEVHSVPVPWPMPPGEEPLQMVPPDARDPLERPPVGEGYDANAIQGDDLMQQYFDRERERAREDI